MPEGNSGKKIGGGLITASSAAVFAAFLAGNLRTQSAADRFAREFAEQRTAGMVHRRIRSVQEGMQMPRAAGPIAASAADVGGAAAQPAERWRDGTYRGWGFSRHGDIEATVVIAGGRIARVAISQCRTRYSCGVIEMLPAQVVKRQSPNVDYVSGASQSADAFYEAVVAALQKAKS